jgi:hypothetical protein
MGYSTSQVSEDVLDLYFQLCQKFFKSLEHTTLHYTGRVYLDGLAPFNHMKTVEINNCRLKNGNSNVSMISLFDKCSK